MKTIKLKEVSVDYINNNIHKPCDVWMGRNKPESLFPLTIEDGERKVNGFPITSRYKYWILDTDPDPLELLEELHKNLDGLDPDENWCISFTDNGWFVFMVWFEDGESRYNGDDDTYFETYADAIRHAHGLAKKYYPQLDWRH